MILPTTWSLSPLSAYPHGDVKENCAEKASTTICARPRASGVFIDRTTSSPLPIYQQSPHTFQRRKNRSVFAHAADAADATRPTSCIKTHDVRNTNYSRLSNILESTTIPVPRKRRASIKSWTRNSKKLPVSRPLSGYAPSAVDDAATSDESGGDSSDSLTSRSSARSYLDSLLASSCDSESDSSTSLSSEVGLLDSSPDGTCQPWSKEYDDLCHETTSRRPITQSTRRTRHARVSSKRQDCTQDHPLLYDSFKAQPSNDDDSTLSRSSLSFSTPKSLNMIGAVFRSNLKTSIRVLKSTTQSVSNFTAPAARSGDYLAQSFFSSSPVPTNGETAAPPVDLFILLELHAGSLNMFFETTREVTTAMDKKNTTSDSAKKERNRAPVQMTTYHQSSLPAKPSRTPTSTSSCSQSSTPSSSTSAHGKSSVTRSRDIRANSDFLRVIVLEMEMRRRGKLRFDVPGRARLFLPPRRSTPVRNDACSSLLHPSKIPQRWVSFTPDTI